MAAISFERHGHFALATRHHLFLVDGNNRRKARYSRCHLLSGGVSSTTSWIGGVLESLMRDALKGKPATNSPFSIVKRATCACKQIRQTTYSPRAVQTYASKFAIGVALSTP